RCARPPGVETPAPGRSDHAAHAASGAVPAVPGAGTGRATGRSIPSTDRAPWRVTAAVAPWPSGVTLRKDGRWGEQGRRAMKVMEVDRQTGETRPPNGPRETGR